MSDIDRNRLLQELDCWSLHGQVDSARFFEHLKTTIPDATTLYLEGNSIAADVHDALSTHIEFLEYAPQTGTLWPRSQKLRVQLKGDVYDTLTELAEGHAEPELCDHLHVYRYDDRMLEWYDAFSSPAFMSLSVPESRIRRFCSLMALEYECRKAAV